MRWIVLLCAAVGCGGLPVEYPDDAAFHRFLEPPALDPPLKKAPGHALHSLDRDATWCASAVSCDDEVVLWQVQPVPRHEVRVKSPGVWSLRLSPDRRWLCTYELMKESRLFYLGDGDVPTPRDPVPIAGTEGTFLADGRSLFAVGKSPMLFRLDGSNGTVRPLAFTLAADETLCVTPDGKSCYIRKKDRVRLVHVGDEGLSPGAALGEIDSREWIEAVDPQGQWVVLSSGNLLRVGSGRVPLAAGKISDAVFAPSGRDLVTVHEDLTARRWSLEENRPDLVSMTELPSVLQDLSWPAADGPILFAYDKGRPAWHPLDGESREVRIGGEGIVWRNPSRIQPRDRAPRLRLSADWSGSEKAVAVRLILTNSGSSDAEGVVGNIEADPPLAEPIRVHFGTVRAEGSVERRISFPVKDRDRIVAFTATVRAPFVVDPFPARWLWVPSGTTTPEAYRALAESIVASSGKILQEVLGRPVSAKVVVFESDQIGFMASVDEVFIEDHHRFTDRAFAEIRRILDASTHEEVVRWSDVLLRFYVPHEMVHVADGGRAGWRAEYIANMVQPYLLLATWDEGDLRRLVAHMERVTRARVPDRYVEGIEAFIAREGEGDALDLSPFQLMEADPAAYVWFGLRVNLDSLARKSSLKDVATRLIRK